MAKSHLSESRSTPAVPAMASLHSVGECGISEQIVAHLVVEGGEIVLPVVEIRLGGESR